MENFIIEFFKIALAAFTGSILGPYFKIFFDQKGKDREKKLKYLEEAYLLANKFDKYANQTSMHLLFHVAALKNQTTPEKMPTIEEEPFTSLHILLDFNLAAPNELKVRVKSLKESIMMCMRPIAQSLTAKPPKDKDELYYE